MEVRLQNRTPYGVAPEPWVEPQALAEGPFEVFARKSRKIRREKTEGHVARSPRALSRVLSLELKGHLEEYVLRCSWVLSLSR
jgi:hypothetical protein